MAADTSEPTINQQREYARIDDLLPISWRQVDPAQFSKIIRYYEKHRAFPPERDDVSALLSSLDITDRLKQVERNDPALAKVLGRLDMKLNLLIRLFHPGEDEQPLVPTPINISGNGIAFWEKDPVIDTGDILEMRIAFSPDALATIECYARVIRLIPDTEQDLTKVACTFDPILSQDREMIVQHIFKRQAEILRSQRGL